MTPLIEYSHDLVTVVTQFTLAHCFPHYQFQAPHSGAPAASAIRIEVEHEPGSSPVRMNAMETALTIFGLDPGTAADWTAAIAALAGTVLSILALKVALAANRTADNARREAKESSDSSAKREAEHAKRALAGSVASWWAADREEEKRRYGVVVSNQSTTNAVFHNVNVMVTGPYSKNETIRMVVLPPGKFFVQQGENIPLPVLPSDVLDPFTVAHDRSINSIEYDDGLGTRWRWTPTTGLIELDRE